MLSKNLPNPEAWILHYQNKQTYFSLAKNVLIVSVCQLLSRVQLFVTPWTGAHQTPPSMGFPRKEYWSGCHSLLQGIFPTQGLNLDIARRLYRLSHQVRLLIAMVSILINQDMFEQSYNDLKFTVQSHNYICTNLILFERYNIFNKNVSSKCEIKLSNCFGLNLLLNCSTAKLTTVNVQPRLIQNGVLLPLENTWL